MSLAKPTTQQVKWAEQEIGVIIHYDIQVFEPSYQFRKQWGYHPDPKIFAPKSLNTDQWIKSAKSAGAKYAVLVAKHCTGFSLWPTEAHDYSVKNSSYDGDIVAEFVASCKKYGLKPGIYYSASCNGYLNVDNPGKVRSGNADEQKKYNDIVRQQITELWGNYGELFEVWFDGGLLSPKDGGPELKDLFDKYQPNAVKFQGSAISETNNLRWVGNEEAMAPINCWATISLDSQFDGVTDDKSIGIGSYDGTRWAPAECDTPNRKRQWFWKENEEKLVLPVKELVKKYEHSVGRNGNLLLGMVIDKNGLFPKKDAEVFKEFGEKISKRFGKPIAQTRGNHEVLTLKFKNENKIDHFVIQENIEKGHVVTQFVIEAKVNGAWKKLFEAKSIGHKRIVSIMPVVTNEIRLKLKGDDVPHITNFSAYFTNDYSLSDKLNLILKPNK